MQPDTKRRKEFHRAHSKGSLWPVSSVQKNIFSRHATKLPSALLYYKTNRLALTAVINSAELLVSRCLDGDASAFRQLYDRYAQAMYNTALRILNSKADAEDILQEAFADAFQNLRSFENKSTFGAWLKQIVVYKSINYLKKKKISFIDMDNSADLAEEMNTDSIWYSVDTIKEAVSELPDGYRTVLSLSLFEGYEHEEIADTLGLAHSTVRTQYMRARQKLVSLLKLRATHEQ